MPSLAWIARQIQTCESKCVFKTRGKALFFANRNGWPMNAYRCPICGHWHLTSSNQTELLPRVANPKRAVTGAPS
jgi:DNA-directed RNA polymerase subunit RPC12/RpoP